MNPTVAALTDPKQLSEESIRRLNAFLDTALKVSCGTLALSVTFRASIVGEQLRAIWILVIAWIALGLVPILYCAIQVFYGAMFSQLVEQQLPIPSEEKLGSAVADQLAVGAAWLVLALIISFLAGMCSLAGFAIANVR